MTSASSPSRFRSSAQALPHKSMGSRVSFVASPMRRLSWPLSSSSSPSPPTPREPSRSIPLALGQAVTMAALSASLLAILMASASVLRSASLHEYDHVLPTRSLQAIRASHRPLTTGSASAPGPLQRAFRQDSWTPRLPQVAWLMSFPNSGTSFTIHMTREASNTTTATNYALEGEIRDQPSVPVRPGIDGAQGPWLEIIPDRDTSLPEKYILTKTHCKGFCSGQFCGADKTIYTVRSFMTGCLSGTKAVETKRGLEKLDVTYAPQQVGKAIHMFRHPLDNVVARFHLEYNVHRARGDEAFTQRFSKDVVGFQRWCALDDSHRGLLTHRLVDRKLRRLMEAIPCFNEFYRYLQWHNLAFSVAHDMNLPTMILHYHEYAQDFEATRDKVLDWLELPRVANGIKFQDGKVYRNYYTRQERQAIRDFLEEFSSFETWEQLKEYDFEADDAPAFNATAAVELGAVL